MEWKWNGSKNLHEAVNKKSGGKADEFLREDKDASSKYLIQNLDVMANWIRYILSLRDSKGNQRIFYIVGDYDVDGCCATAELYILLKKLGAERVVIRTPKRTEGYGMSEKIVSEFNEIGTIITVDNGIAAHAAILAAKKRGFTVIVTDHHMPTIENGRIILPAADLIIDPHVEGKLIAKNNLTPTIYQDYCGAGIVYKLAQYMIPGTLELDQISAMAALATIADVVPLTGDNRNIYKSGIDAIKRYRITKGTQKLVDVLNTKNVVSETNIGFKLAPMLNAPGRLYPDGANLSINTLLSNSYQEASEYVMRLNEVNEKRKTLKTEAVNRAEEIIQDDCLFGMNPIVIVDPETAEGVIGLVAGYLTEKYNTTSIVFTKTEEAGKLKGSCRAPEYCNIRLGLDKVHDAHPEYFFNYGGHAAAAGVSIHEEFVSEFTEAMQEAMGPAQPAPDYVEYDLEIEAGDIARVTEEMQKYVPFGEGNPQLVVKVKNFKLSPNGSSFYQYSGKNNENVKFFGAGAEAIGFGLSHIYEKERFPMTLDIVGKLDYHRFRGTVNPQIEMLDMRGVAVPETKKTDISKKLNETLGALGLQFT